MAVVAGDQHVDGGHHEQGGQPRLHRPHQVFGDLVLPQDVRVEAEVGGGELAVRRLDVQDRPADEQASSCWGMLKST